MNTDKQINERDDEMPDVPVPHDEGRSRPTPHDPDATHAGDGRGTTTSVPEHDTLNRPILDGASMSDEEEHDVDNPWRGLEDPALSRHPETGEKSKNPYGG